MKVFLLHRDRDLDVKPSLRDAVFAAMLSGDLFAIANVHRELERARRSGQAPEEPAGDDAELVQDLELETLWTAMAGGDEFVYETCKRVVLSSLDDVDSIRYRQQVLADCLEHADVVQQLYALALEALESERKVGSFWHGMGPERTLHRSVQVLTLHLDVLRRLRRLAEEQAGSFRSEGFGRFFAAVREELADEYLAEVEQHLSELGFRRGVLETARLGPGFKGRGYTVHRPRAVRWTERLPLASRPESYGFTIPARDENGLKALGVLRDRGLNTVANAVGQSADHVKSFFAMLRLELAFYLGCLVLRERLRRKGEPACLPEPRPAGEAALSARGLYDVCLSLHLDDRVIGNDVDADGKALVVVTGANQGGKSTFLRSVGLAQLMLQCGMFVGADSFRADLCSGVFTHSKREEDAAMESGKLDEELARMSGIAGRIGRHGLLLCNESFASTNEREGSEIARQVVRALIAKQIRVVFVTHMYDLAHGLHAQRRDDALFLRAERRPDGGRTFRIVEGEPLPTSYGEDSYRRIFGAAAGDALAGPGR